MPRNYLLITESRLQPPEPPPTQPDARLEYYGEVYVANPSLRAIGVSFEMFLQSPETFLFSVLTLVPLPADQRYHPLLPQQRAVQEHLDAAAAGQLSLPLAEVAA
jgi:hypothetical protein